MRVVIQGGNGSFHVQAAEQWFGNEIDIIPAKTFSDVFQSLNDSKADMAVVAIENSLYGSINEVLDLVETHSHPIIGEVYLRIKQQLIGLPGASIKIIEKIYSQDVALAQCEQYFDTHLPHAQRIEYYDTGASVKLVKEQNNPTVAAVAGETAAAFYNLPILARDIEDDKANFTRFLVLSREGGSSLSPTDKASIVFTTNHTPGALANILAIFAKLQANITKIQSRPIIGKPWRSRFYLDIEIDQKRLALAIRHLQENDAKVTILGTYTAAISTPF